VAELRFYTRVVATLLVFIFWSTQSEALEKLTVGHGLVIDFIPAYVAKKKGFFEKHGLDVTLEVLHNVGNNPAALASNSVQIGTMSPPQLILADAGGLNLKFITGGSYTAPAYHLAGIAVRPDLDIKSPKDLEGKKIAVVGINAFLHILLVDWLEKNDVDVHKIKFVELPFAQLGDALRSRSVDAITSVDPFLSRIVASGAGRLLNYYTDTLPEGITPAGFAVTEEFATKHADAIQNFRLALKDGLQYYREHPEQIDDILSEFLPMPADIIKSIPRPPLRIEIGVDQMKFWVTLMKHQNLLSGPVNPADFIVP
jgi:NitT/TauT family transport system substrate-binding protein